MIPCVDAEGPKETKQHCCVLTQVRTSKKQHSAPGPDESTVQVTFEKSAGLEQVESITLGKLRVRDAVDILHGTHGL